MKGNASTIILTKNRLEALADGLYAIVMTLLVLELSIPVIAGSSVDAELLRKLLDLWPKILIYMLSFLVLGSGWINHHVMFHYIARSDGKLAWMNIILLMFVALIPFSASLLGEYIYSQVAAVVYGMNLLLIVIGALLIWIYITGKHTLADRAINAEVAVRRRIMYLVGCSFYILGISISFISPITSVCIYAVATLLTIIITWKDSHGYLSKIFVGRRRKTKKKL